MRIMRWSLCIGGAVLAASCVYKEEAQTEVTTAEIGCGPNCLGNSPIAGALGPYEFDLTGVVPSPRNWLLYPDSWTLGGWPLTHVKVAGARLTATWWQGGNPQFIENQGLDGASFRMHHATDGDFDFHILTSIPVNYYPNVETPTRLPPMWAYYIKYRETGTQDLLEDLCPYTEQADHGLSVNFAVFWRGDRYNPISGRIIASGDGPTGVGNFVNLSCAGEAPPKMLRAGAGEAVAPSSSRELRQSVFNMFMAKYCPKSIKRYTKLGEDLYWHGTPRTVFELGFSESIWNSEGAICLDVQRTYAAGDAKDDCDLPSCAGMLADWQEHGSLVSATP